MIYGTIGTVSHGTLRTRDLVDTFAAELASLVRADNREWLSQRANQEAHRRLVSEARAGTASTSDDDLDGLLEELQDALGEYAPEGCYFGAHPGDGSDFGFWPHDD